MTTLFVREIAGFTFVVRSRSPLTVENSSPVYQQFIPASHHPDVDEVLEVWLELDNLPDTGRMRKIFDTEESWSMFFDEDSYFLELKPEPLQEPLWIVRFDSSFRNTTIYCGEPSLRRKHNRAAVLDPFGYPLDQILLMYLLAGKQGAIVHAAGMSMHGKGYIFPGRSGAGKSTVSRLLLGNDTATMLSDDRIIIRRRGNAFRAFGTPWPGDACIAVNRSSELGGIFFIHHASENSIKKMTPSEALKRILPVTSIPWYDEKPMSDILQFCEDLVYAVPAYELFFRPDDAVSDFMEKFLLAGSEQ